MHLSIVTGASRGLGRAVAEQLLQRGHRVLSLSRGTWQSQQASSGELICWSVDLADSQAAAERLREWLASQKDGALSATLINNAGVVSQLAPLSAVGAADLANAIRVGLEAPMLLTAAFLSATEAWAVPRKVLMVSSGLGRRAMAGSASYCAAKAGMDHLARAVALEEADKPGGARIVSLAPGVIDTDMQAQLRAADETLFPERKVFVGLQQGAQLDSPALAATKLLAYLDRADFGANPVADVRDA